MSSTRRTLISPEEYLAMTFGDREPEYVRGELIYKPMSDYAHAFLQMMLGSMLIQALSIRGYTVLSELLSRLGPDNYRLPDIAVYGPEQKAEPLPSAPPHVAIEIISRDESYSEMLQKLEDYQAWGVPNIWTVDPRRRKLSVFANDTLKTVDTLTLAGTEFAVTLEQLMEKLPSGAL